MMVFRNEGFRQATPNPQLFSALVTDHQSKQSS
jgi:hypothetical protein